MLFTDRVLLIMAASNGLNDMDKDTKSLDASLVNEEATQPGSTSIKPARPPLVYSSPKAFATSFAARWKSVWSRPFVISLIAGQIVSLCITCTNVTTTELVSRGWTLSTTQGIFLYVHLFFFSSLSRTLLNLY